METLQGNDELTDDALTSEFRVWQRRRGHRFSVDDLLTAYQAATCKASVSRHLDLGCGIGSVLLMVAHAHPQAVGLGVEAQEISFALAQRNLERNGVEGRLSVLRGDIRDEALLCALGHFDLVTGTPPYKPPTDAVPSPDSQRAYARIEYRGGVEAYLQAASRCLAPGGRLVLCCANEAVSRLYAGAGDVGLHVLAKRQMIAREGRDQPLFCVFTLATEPAADIEMKRFVARDAAGEYTKAYRDLRAYFGP